MHQIYQVLDKFFEIIVELGCFPIVYYKQDGERVVKIIPLESFLQGDTLDIDGVYKALDTLDCADKVDLKEVLQFIRFYGKTVRLYFSTTNKARFIYIKYINMAGVSQSRLPTSSDMKLPEFRDFIEKLFSEKVYYFY